MNKFAIIVLTFLLAWQTRPVAAQQVTLSDSDILARRLENVLKKYVPGLTLSITYLPAEDERAPLLPSLVVTADKFIPVKDSHRIETQWAQMKQIAEGLNENGWLKQAKCMRFPMGHLPIDHDIQRPAYVIRLNNGGWCYQQNFPCNAQVYRQILVLQKLCPPTVAQAVNEQLLEPLAKRYPQWEKDAEQVKLSSEPNPAPRDPIEHHTDQWKPQRFYQAMFGLDGKLEIVTADIANYGAIDGDIQYRFTAKPKANGYYTFIFVLTQQWFTRQIRFVHVQAHQNDKLSNRAVRISPETANLPNPVAFVRTGTPFDIGWRFYPGGEGTIGGWELAAIHYSDKQMPYLKTCLKLLLSDHR